MWRRQHAGRLAVRALGSVERWSCEMRQAYCGSILQSREESGDRVIGSSGEVRIAILVPTTKSEGLQHESACGNRIVQSHFTRSPDHPITRFISVFFQNRIHYVVDHLPGSVVPQRMVVNDDGERDIVAASRSAVS